jgi:uncharacterized OB-fold protein
VNPVSAPYWEAAARGELVAQRCRACARYVLYPRSSCPHCGSLELTWTPVSGRATVHTFTIARRPTHPDLADRVPYAIAIVELEEGPHLTTNLVECGIDRVRIGMPVEVVFERRAGRTLPVFRPRPADAPTAAPTPDLATGPTNPLGSGGEAGPPGVEGRRATLDT